MARLGDLVRIGPAAEERRRSTLDDVFAEEPVSLSTFVQDKKFLNNPALGPVQYAAVQHIERIYYQELYPLMAEEFDPYWAEPIRMVNMITLQWGKGSGKDHICRMASLRIAYLLQCLRNPQQYYGLPQQDTIHMLNVASSSQQANQAFFTPMTRVVKTGWFADRCHPKPGLGLITWAKNVEMVSGHADAESQEGLNIILGVADEIDAFKMRDEFMRANKGREPLKSAEGILKMLRGSAVTRFPDTFKNVRISYPRFQGSMIQRLTKEAKDDIEKRGLERSRHYVSGPLATWDVNPRYDRFPRISIPGTDVLVPDLDTITDDYDANPDGAKGIYECRPSRAIDTYFKNLDAIRAIFDGEQPIEVDYVLRPVRSSHTNEVVESWEPEYTFAPDFVPIQGARYAMHGDLAVTGDRAGIAMSHVVRYETVEDVLTDQDGSEFVQSVEKPVIQNDFTITFGADARTKPPREIQIRWARMLAFELIKLGFNIVSFTFDGFQSTDSMQIFEQHGIASERLSMDLSENPWKNLRDVIYDGRLTAPFSQLLLSELESLGRFGGKVDHPPSGSKDASDALCGSVDGAIKAGGEESETGEVAHPGAESFEVGYDTQFMPDGFGDAAYSLGYSDSWAV